MSLVTIIADKNNQYIPLVKVLYSTAFPPKEQIRFSLIFKLCEKGKGDLLIFVDDGVFVGFTFIINYKDLAFIVFFAIDDNIRGKGYGGKSLALIKEFYANKRIILNIESPSDNACNQEQRLKRKLFYLRNGYTETGISTQNNGENLDLMILGGTIKLQEYPELLCFMLGKILFWLIRLKITYNNINLKE